MAAVLVMRNRLIAFVVLFTLGCGLVSGPHPCQARQVPSSSDETAEMACHSGELASYRSEGPSISSSGGHDCCAQEHGSLCEYACQTVGVVRAEVPRVVIQPLAGTTAPRVDRLLSLFAHAIDHIPLA